MTVVELVVGVLLVSLLAVLFFRLFRFQKLSWYNVEKLGVIQDLRTASRRYCADTKGGVAIPESERRALRDELELATAFLYPPAGTIDRVYRRLVFTGPENDLHIIYWKPDGSVAVRGIEEDPKVLVGNVVDFKVRQPIDGQVCIEITAEGELDGSRGRVSIGISAFADNRFKGE